MHNDPLEGSQPGEMVPLFFRTLSESSDSVPTCQLPEASPEPQEDREALVRTAREEGRREAALLLQQEMETRVQSERESVIAALDSFLSEKRRYFSGLEKEVVRLALAIAERVLHRESAMDPTLLAAAARVALEQVDQESEAVLLVAAGDADNWRKSLESVGREITLKVDATMRRGECVLQTEAGSFELGMQAQLCEIERGFFELIGRTPALFT